MKPAIIILSSLLMLAPPAKSQTLEEKLKETGFPLDLLRMVQAMKKRDSLKLSQFIDRNTGVYILNRIGVYDTYKHYPTIGFSDTTYPNVPFYDSVLFYPPRYEELPGFDCTNEEWSKAGVFVDTTKTDHLLSEIAHRLNKVIPGQVPPEKIKEFVALENSSRRVVFTSDKGHELILYLSYIRERWRVVIIDKVTCDCSS